MTGVAHRVSDLRSYIEVLEEAGEVARISAPVSLNQEIGAICRRNLDNHGPGLVFERPGGSDIPLAVDLLASRRRYALALGLRPDQLADEWNRRVSSPTPPVVVDRGACQENVLLGDEVDLTRLPAPIWNALDGGPYLTLSCHITKDPETGIGNVGLYRNQVHNRNTLGLLAAPYTHLGLHRRKAPNEPFPVALALGPDPVVVMAATAAVPFGTDELLVASSLREMPLELVQCLTIPLAVPASSQIVLEGEILPDVAVEEGPFGEFTGYYGGPRAPRQIIRIKAMTFQNSPILHATYEGLPPHESAVLTSVPREAELARQIKLPGVKRVHITTAGGGSLHAVISVDKPYEGFGKAVALAVLGTHPGRFIKRIIVVDADIDPFDPVAVEWAIATRVQADRDVDVIKAVTGIVLDPSLPEAEQHTTGRTSKMIIDATRYDAKSFSAVCLPAADVMEQVERDWERYGIPLREPQA